MFGETQPVGVSTTIVLCVFFVEVYTKRKTLRRRNSQLTTQVKLLLSVLVETIIWIILFYQTIANTNCMTVDVRIAVIRI